MKIATFLSFRNNLIYNVIERRVISVTIIYNPKIKSTNNSNSGNIWGIKSFDSRLRNFCKLIVKSLNNLKSVLTF
ncbi:MAG: hypothetical protein COT85_02950 [Chlamydiae bacterium CG10_big_fil_rev_8_21_14_0_10_42_34]|nr:MAG: hypothetical protein COT85_02950 [Chlamydiae bacterium CG10_big_fil_rev_8_21_14_0_10_42_34]